MDVLKAVEWHEAQHKKCNCYECDESKCCAWVRYPPLYEAGEEVKMYICEDCFLNLISKANEGSDDLDEGVFV